MSKVIFVQLPQLTSSSSGPPSPRTLLVRTGNFSIPNVSTRKWQRNVLSNEFQCRGGAQLELFVDVILEY